jgi:hypothetical protein
MNEDYMQGFDAAFESMRDYFEMLDLSLAKCKELSLLINDITNWQSANEAQHTVRIIDQIMDEVKNKFYLEGWYGKRFNHRY